MKVGMTEERWHELMTEAEIDREWPQLTAEELAAGWHFCPEWDGLLIGPGMEEMNSCLCGEE